MVFEGVLNCETVISRTPPSFTWHGKQTVWHTRSGVHHRLILCGWFMPSISSWIINLFSLKNWTLKFNLTNPEIVIFTMKPLPVTQSDLHYTHIYIYNIHIIVHVYFNQINSTSTIKELFPTNLSNNFSQGDPPDDKPRYDDDDAYDAFGFPCGRGSHFEAGGRFVSCQSCSCRIYADFEIRRWWWVNST